MEHQLFLTSPPAHIGDKKGVNHLVNKNNNLDSKERVVKEESKFIKLGLGICADGSEETSDVDIKDSKVIPVISVKQLQELHQQVLIFNYIASGVAVPSKLVVSIWKRVASSVFGSVSCGIPSNFSSYFRPRGINYKSLMDSEPGRCRRTDGNKWRCRKDVVPDTKYCERHMHRGRSRKHVETSKITLQLNTPAITYPSSNTSTTTCSRKTIQEIKSHDDDDKSAKLSTPVPEHQQNKFPTLSESKGLSCTATTMTTSANGKSKTTSDFVENDKSSREINDGHNGVDTGSGDIEDKNNKGNSTNSDKNGGPVTPELNISAKSVVKGVTISSYQVYERRGVTAEETQRCKRTDGKRWRCSKEAIPQQKYCGSHMHRGSKRCKTSSEADIVTAASEALASISAVKCSQPIVINLDSSTGGSSSDATTVTDTDENTSASHILPLST